MITLNYKLSVAEEIFISEYIEFREISVPLLYSPANMSFRGKRLLRTGDGSFTLHKTSD